MPARLGSDRRCRRGGCLTEWGRTQSRAPPTLRRRKGAAVRVVIALGGNAMTAADGSARPRTSEPPSTAADASRSPSWSQPATEVVLTHGNGPQVGNLLVKNELAAERRAPGAAGLVRRADPGAPSASLILNALDARWPTAARRPGRRRWSPARSSTRDDPGFANPTKPIGRYLPQAEAARADRATARSGRTAASGAGAGWSPRPSRWRCSTRPRCAALAGRRLRRRGRRRRRHPGGPRRRTATAARRRGGDRQGPGRRAAGPRRRRRRPGHRDRRRRRRASASAPPDARPLGRSTVAELRGHAAEGQFASGCMGPKVEAACRFVERAASARVITSLDRSRARVAREAGTVVDDDPADTDPQPEPSER